MPRVIFAARRKTGLLDLEAVEQATRDALHQAGAGLLETLLNEDEPAASQQPCSCGETVVLATSRGPLRRFNLAPP